MRVPAIIATRAMPERMVNSDQDADWPLKPFSIPSAAYLKGEIQPSHLNNFGALSKV